MNKRIYRIVRLEKVDADSLAAKLQGKRAVFAVDIAKTDMVAAFRAAGEEVATTIGWKAPYENGRLLELLRGLREAGIELEVAMEPSGTYGDALRHHLVQAGFSVYRVSGKRTHDAAEVYDGVPSLHDAKCAAIVAKLHFDGLSRPWLPASDHKRQLHAALATMDLYQDHYLRLVHRLESWLARHWPEVTAILELTQASLLALLARIGGPQRVAAKKAESVKLLRGMSHGLLDDEKIELAVRSAGTTWGVPMMDDEHAALQVLAEEAHRAGKLLKGARRRVEELGLEGAAQPISVVTGKTTAAVLVHDVGDPTAFGSSRAYLKAFGLNLKEKSSGQRKGQLTITKRGPSRARKYLWLAACRWLQKDSIARAWYEQKVRRDGGKKTRAVVALMRKLGSALFHVARGAPFDSRKVFDVSRLAPAA